MREAVMFFVHPRKREELQTVGIGKHERRNAGHAARLSQEHQVHLHLRDRGEVGYAVHIDLHRRGRSRAGGRRIRKLLFDRSNPGQMRVEPSLIRGAQTTSENSDVGWPEVENALARCTQPRELHRSQILVRDHLRGHLWWALKW